MERDSQSPWSDRVSYNNRANWNATGKLTGLPPGSRLFKESIPVRLNVTGDSAIWIGQVNQYSIIQTTDGEILYLSPMEYEEI